MHKVNYIVKDNVAIVNLFTYHEKYGDPCIINNIFLAGCIEGTKCINQFLPYLCQLQLLLTCRLLPVALVVGIRGMVKLLYVAQSVGDVYSQAIIQQNIRNIIHPRIPVLDIARPPEIIQIKLAFIGYATTGSGILLAISLCRLHDFISVSILNTLPGHLITIDLGASFASKGLFA